MKKITLNGDLLTVEGRAVHIGEFSLVHEAIGQLLIEREKYNNLIMAVKKIIDEEIVNFTKGE